MELRRCFFFPTLISQKVERAWRFNYGSVWDWYAIIEDRHDPWTIWHSQLASHQITLKGLNLQFSSSPPAVGFRFGTGRPKFCCLPFIPVININTISNSTPCSVQWSQTKHDPAGTPFVAKTTCSPHGGIFQSVQTAEGYSGNEGNRQS